MLKGKLSIIKSFFKDLDKKSQENNCFLHVSKMTLRMKLYSNCLHGLEKNNNARVNNKIK